jgi:hypothetical protein
MRFLKTFLIAGLMLMAGCLVGCNKAPPRMKGQPTNLNSGDIKVPLPDKAKVFPAGQ